MTVKRWMPAGVLAAALSFVAGNARAADVRSLIELMVKQNAEAAQSQARVDKAGEATSTLLEEYRATQKQLASIKVYNQQIQKLVDSQQTEIDSLRKQLDEVVVVQREITPLMMRMIDSLDAFVKLDVPFLTEERAGRVKTLREMMNRADVTESEKFRRVLEAYQVENEYGRTIESYRANLEVSGQSRTVDFLRVGRVALIYMTLDQKEMGAWSQEKRAWEMLDSSQWRDTIIQGLRVAKKQTAPDLLRLPLSAAKEASR